MQALLLLQREHAVCSFRRMSNEEVESFAPELPVGVAFPIGSRWQFSGMETSDGHQNEQALFVFTAAMPSMRWQELVPLHGCVQGVPYLHRLCKRLMVFLGGLPWRQPNQSTASCFLHYCISAPGNGDHLKASSKH